MTGQHSSLLLQLHFIINKPAYFYLVLLLCLSVMNAMPSPTTIMLPVIDLTAFLENGGPNSEEAQRECLKASEAIRQYSAFAIRDYRVSDAANAAFLDLIEDYFAQSTEEKMKDVRPEFHYQVGATPSGQEVPRCSRDEGCLDFVDSLPPADRPGPFESADPKWRFFWRIGEQPPETAFPQLNANPVIPERFADVWARQMNKWGNLLHRSISTLSRMLAIGFGMPQDTFTNMTEYGPHLLAPTGTDLNEFGAMDTVLAGFHTDLNFLTIHGKSRFPGLHIWTRDNRRLRVQIPDGCLLVQAGKQMEYLTGGQVQAGYHEVVVLPETWVAIKKQEQKGRPLWRISSTLFSHIASDQVLKPLPPFATPEATTKYPEILAGDQVKQELGLINLGGEVEPLNFDTLGAGDYAGRSIKASLSQ